MGEKEMIVNEMMRGNMDMERYHKIISNLLNYIKPSFNKDQRKIFGLLLALSNETKDNIKVLLSLTSNKKRNLKAMIEQSQVTENIKNYFSTVEGNYEAYAQKIVIDK